MTKIKKLKDSQRGTIKGKRNRRHIQRGTCRFHQIASLFLVLTDPSGGQRSFDFVIFHLISSMKKLSANVTDGSVYTRSETDVAESGHFARGQCAGPSNSVTRQHNIDSSGPCIYAFSDRRVGCCAHHGALEILLKGDSNTRL
ncbi:hypothetical protein GHT06_018201 [Daphnia sinensis]|uniref:Uncharacterized protein n=1 Tax=Daphnia sinensis TaxID=1820382 RepID=A0AAD5L450_9CRUS|nr:hypothetical protein GHT06_018201 [Daphnia sinensis]